MDPIDPNTFYLPYSDDYDGFTILKTTDGGATWKDLYAGLVGDVSSVNALLIDRNTPSTLGPWPGPHARPRGTLITV